MKVVLDTNVFVSGLFWKGPPFEILQAFRDRKFHLIVSPEILEEYNQVIDELSHKYGAMPSAISKILELVEQYAEMVMPSPFQEQVCDDPDDDIFISTALAGNAECLVSGDKALLRVGQYQNVSILTAKMFIIEKCK